MIRTPAHTVDPLSGHGCDKLPERHYLTSWPWLTLHESLDLPALYTYKYRPLQDTRTQTATVLDKRLNEFEELHA